MKYQKALDKLNLEHPIFFDFGMGLMNIGEPSGVRIVRELKNTFLMIMT